MDSSGDTNKNDTNQSQQPSSIVSSMTTATPITSEIVSDFEPDPKFEITPLERASYDCPEIYSNDNQIEQDDHQNLLSDNNDDTSQTSSSDQQQSQQPPQPQQQLQSQQPTEQEKITQELTKLPQVGDEVRLTKSVLDQSSHSRANLTEELSMLAGVCTGLPIISGSNDCKMGKSHQDSGSSLVNNDIQVPLIPDSEHQIHTEKPNNDRTDLFGPIEVTGVTPARTDGQQQQSTAETYKGMQEQSDRESDVANLYSLSQSTVDAQMEQVIDNIVELGGGHQFSQSLGHAEDKEKLLESIHREITSDRSSIDLIADVASRQQSIEIAPTIIPETQPCPSSAQRQQEPDLIKIDKVPKVDEIPTGKPKETNPSSGAKANNYPETAEIKEDSSRPVKEEVAQPPPGMPAEPIIEKPAPQSTGGISSQDQMESRVQGLHAEDLDRIVVEPLGTNDEKAQDSHLKPVVEEAPSTGDDMPQESMEKATTAKTDNGKQTLPEPEVLKEEVVRHVPMEVDEHKSPEPAVRKSGRKIKTVEKVEAAMSAKRSKRAEKTIEKAIRKPVEDAVEDTVEGSSKVETQPASKEDVFNLPQNIKTVEEPEKSVQVVPEDPPSMKSEPEVVAEPPSAPEDGTQAETSPTKQDTRARRAVRERLSRVLRTREATKRSHEEEPPSAEPPKVEPPKKQVKKSRGLKGESTTSYEAAKNTPLIKLPNYKARQTISTSDPITRLDKRYEPTAPTTSQPDSEKKFLCHQCGFSTTRLENLVYHSTKGFCKGKCEMAEVMKADIIRQQQQAKTKRKSIR